MEEITTKTFENEFEFDEFMNDVVIFDENTESCCGFGSGRNKRSMIAMMTPGPFYNWKKDEVIVEHRQVFYPKIMIRDNEDKLYKIYKNVVIDIELELSIDTADDQNSNQMFVPGDKYNVKSSIHMYASALAGMQTMGPEGRECDSLVKAFVLLRTL